MDGLSRITFTVMTPRQQREHRDFVIVIMSMVSPEPLAAQTSMF